MACTSCGGSVSQVADYTTALAETTDVIDTGAIRPRKIGEPLSTACERANVVGSIPVVIRYPSYTLVSGGAVAGITSSAGISEDKMASFFTYNLYSCYSQNARVASTCA